MGQNRFKEVDILNVHDYSRKVKVEGMGEVPAYKAYYEYFVTDSPMVYSDTVPKEMDGKYGWRYNIYERGTDKLLRSAFGGEDSYAAARGTAQRAIKKAMEAFKS